MEELDLIKTEIITQMEENQCYQRFTKVSVCLFSDEILYVFMI